MASKPLSRFLTTRVTAGDLKEFRRLSAKYGTPSDVLREIVRAFNDDRLIIKQPTQPTKGLFHVN